ncbi:rhodanese-like domain-containing protein [Bacteroides heparinolyticus]|uniref:Rhodanese domain protein n=3 Tax=Prevotella heparinolytica TaxID=28113 RepID=A0A449I1A0_9BACE|nr:rhodanese-like domain-containing protein [Bacteroides heparinolyticus]MCF0255486.1 rhodanese-like domain-containing protein [Bacteroides heparinolyticus]MCI6213352.1 rhodanese-like domain-containing protein [Bacteroides heparinolyticus]VFB13178.1 Rhodanese domain protein [Bacteroides heparinolyticus]
MKILFTSLCLFFSTLFSCQQKGNGFKSLSVDEFAALIANPEVQRLDVRTVVEYSEEHIPGSININVLDKNFETVTDSVLQKDKPVALYCRSGKRSKKAASILSEKGYTVYDLSEGFIGWLAAGKQTEK